MSGGDSSAEYSGMILRCGRGEHSRVEEIEENNRREHHKESLRSEDKTAMTLIRCR